MQMPVNFIPAPPRRVGQKKRVATPPTPIVAGPALTEADFNADGLTLFFDRDVTLGAFDGAAIVVNDPASGSTYVGTSAHVESGFIVSVGVEATGPSTGDDAVMNAGANSGIVALDTGAAWAGVEGFALSE